VAFSLEPTGWGEGLFESDLNVTNGKGPTPSGRDGGAGVR